MPAPAVRVLSTTLVRPTTVDRQESPDLIPLTLWDLPILSVRYIQKGLLFSHKPSAPNLLLPHLTASLSHALSLYYPLAGRLLTRLSPDSASASFFIHCNGQGAELVHAAADGVSVADVAAADVPTEVVYDLFPLNYAVNHDGHSKPLLAVQVTELVDGYFLGCAFNHVVGDGTAFWRFFGSWAEITRTGSSRISRPPAIRGCLPVVEEADITSVPFVNPDDFIERSELPSGMKDRFFHFTAAAIAKLKGQAQRQDKKVSVSSFQALSALVWRAIVRAWKLPADVVTTYRFSADCRPRLAPPLPGEYFGNAIGGVADEATVSELLGNGLGWAAARVRERIAAFDDKAVRELLDSHRMSPVLFKFSDLSHRGQVLMGSSSKFDVYEVDFGWGRAVAVRSGIDNKFEGKVMAFPAREGGGGVELEICLSSVAMAALLADTEFMEAANFENLVTPFSCPYCPPN